MSLWSEALDATKQLFSLAQETRQNKAEIHDLREELNSVKQEMKEMSSAIERLAYEVQRVSEHDHHERELLVLRLENQMLRFERRLPPPKSENEDAG